MRGLRAPARRASHTAPSPARCQPTPHPRHPPRAFFCERFWPRLIALGAAVLQGHFVQDGGGEQLAEAVLRFIDRNPPPLDAARL